MSPNGGEVRTKDAEGEIRFPLLLTSCMSTIMWTLLPHYHQPFIWAIYMWGSNMPVNLQTRTVQSKQWVCPQPDCDDGPQALSLLHPQASRLPCCWPHRHMALLPAVPTTPGSLATVTSLKLCLHLRLLKYTQGCLDMISTCPQI